MVLDINEEGCIINVVMLLSESWLIGVSIYILTVNIILAFEFRRVTLLALAYLRFLICSRLRVVYYQFKLCTPYVSSITIQIKYITIIIIFFISSLVLYFQLSIIGHYYYLSF